MSQPRVSFGSRAGAVSDYQGNTASSYYHRRSVAQGPCSSLEELINALKEEIDAGAHTSVPECTTSELSLGLSASVPLIRPGIGPYSEGGDHDLPPEYKNQWTQASDGDAAGSPQKLDPPVASVQAILSHNDQHARHIMQRAASRGITAAIEGLDGFKYSFNNAWGAKDEDGQRFSYICQDSMQNKDRHANGFARTQKHLKGEGERGARKETYDCKGSVSIKCSLVRGCIDVYYRHYAIHPTIQDRRNLPRPPPRPRQRSERTAETPVAARRPQDTGGLFGMLQAEESAYDSPPQNKAMPAASQQQVSNIGKPLKRKRDHDSPQQSRSSGKELSLFDLLRQSDSAARAPAESPPASNSSTSFYPPPVVYDLPSWQKPAPPPAPLPIPKTHVAKTPQRSGQFATPYPPPYQPTQPYPQPPQHHMPPPPVPRQTPQSTQPRNQGLFTTLKPVAQDPPINMYVPAESIRAKTSCTSCRLGKKKCDEARPICSSCQKSGKYDCHYEGAYNYAPTVPSWPRATQNVAPSQPQPLLVPPRQPSPDPWFPKR